MALIIFEIKRHQQKMMSHFTFQDNQFLGLWSFGRYTKGIMKRFIMLGSSFESICDQASHHACGVSTSEHWVPTDVQAHRDWPPWTRRNGWGCCPSKPMGVNLSLSPNGYPNQAVILIRIFQVHLFLGGLFFVGVKNLHSWQGPTLKGRNSPWLPWTNNTVGQQALFL